MDKVNRPKAERFVGKFLKQCEVIELFDAVEGHKLELGVILGAYYGLRRSDEDCKHKTKKYYEFYENISLHRKSTAFIVKNERCAFFCVA